MEVAGTITGLIGLVGLFNSCVQIFDAASAYATLGEDFQILLTKIRTEKIILRAWGDGVGLAGMADLSEDVLEDACSPRLRRRETFENVVEILGTMVHCFRRVEECVRTYSSCCQGEDGTERKRIGYGRPEFARDADLLRSFTLASGKHQESTGVRLRLRWVFRDKARLKDYAFHLKDLNENLHRLVQPNFELRIHRIGVEIESIVDIPTLERMSQEVDHHEVAFIAAERTATLSNCASQREGGSTIYDSFESLPRSNSESRYQRSQRTSTTTEYFVSSPSIPLEQPAPHDEILVPDHLPVQDHTPHDEVLTPDQLRDLEFETSITRRESLELARPTSPDTEAIERFRLLALTLPMINSPPSYGSSRFSRPSMGVSFGDTNTYVDSNPTTREGSLFDKAGERGWKKASVGVFRVFTFSGGEGQRRMWAKVLRKVLPGKQKTGTEEPGEVDSESMEVY